MKRSKQDSPVGGADGAKGAVEGSKVESPGGAAGSGTGPAAGTPAPGQADIQALEKLERSNAELRYATMPCCDLHCMRFTGAAL